MIVLAIDTDMRRGEIFKMCLQRKLKKKAGSRREISGCPLLYLASDSTAVAWSFCYMP